MLIHNTWSRIDEKDTPKQTKNTPKFLKYFLCYKSHSFSEFKDCFYWLMSFCSISCDRGIYPYNKPCFMAIAVILWICCQNLYALPHHFKILISEMQSCNKVLSIKILQISSSSSYHAFCLFRGILVRSKYLFVVLAHCQI